MEWGKTMIKYILFILNLVFAVWGIVLMAVSIGLYHKIYEVSEINDVFATMGSVTIPALCVTCGTIIFFMSFAGSWGIAKDSYCMILSHAGFLLIFLIGQIIFGFLLFVYIGDIQQGARVFLQILWENRDQPANRELWEQIQSGLKCCSYKSPIDWHLTAPISCCPPGVKVCTIRLAYKTGCGIVLNDFIDTAGSALGYVMLGVAAVKIFGFILTLHLANKVRNNE